MSTEIGPAGKPVKGNEPVTKGEKFLQMAVPLLARIDLAPYTQPHSEDRLMYMRITDDKGMPSSGWLTACVKVPKPMTPPPNAYLL